MSKPRAWGKVANFGRTDRNGAFFSDSDGLPPPKTGRWPEDIRDSRAWLEGGDEATLNVYWDTLKKCGLNTFSRRSRPSHQDRRNRHDIHTIERWKVGVYLAFADVRVPGSVGPWWMGGKSVMDRLVAIPRGRRRIEVAAAVCAFIGMDEGDPGGLPERAVDFLRRLG